MHEIIYLEALRDYTCIVTSNRKYAVLSPLGTLIKEKGFSSFVRIHRSYAIQKHYVTKITSKEIFLANRVLPIGRSYKEQLNF